MLQKYYTRFIGVFFVLVVISLITDFMSNGYSAETWHKVFHVLLGIIIIYFGWNNKHFWKPFCLVNVAFFLYLGLFGFAFPDFGGLDAFNFIDSVLHTIVGVSGLVIGWLKL